MSFSFAEFKKFILLFEGSDLSTKFVVKLIAITFGFCWIKWQTFKK
jgi:hypothetical protein